MRFIDNEKSYVNTCLTESIFHAKCSLVTPVLTPQVNSMSSTRGQSPPPAWSSTCARVRRRRTRRRGQRGRSSRPDVRRDPPKSSTKEASPPRHRRGLRPPLRPATPQPSLSLVSAFTESVAAPHFSSTTGKNKPTNIAEGRCLCGAWRWNEAAWRGWMRITHTLIAFCGRRGERRARTRLDPHHHTSFFLKWGGDASPNAGTCHLSHTLSSHC